jgi:glucose-6-phosphate isomerase
VLRERVRVITAEPTSTLGQLATQQGWTIIPHPPTLGGRYSVFSVVGMVPAAFAGLPVEKMLQRAEHCLQHLLQQNDPSLHAHAAWLAANLDEKPMQLLMAYADRLRPATQWYKQLWAESLGKDGKGGTPVTAIGAIDQHSQLQLYLDGPRDKLVTLWLPDVRGMGNALPSLPVAGLKFLQGHRIGDVMVATAEATVETMAAQGVPLRVLRGPLTPETLAGWMARQMLETMLVAHLIGVDPYSQPAVETGKKRTRAALAGQAS